MDWKVVMEFVRPELGMLIVFLWCIGLFLKLYPKFNEEWMIPFILWVTGMVFAVLYIAMVLGEGFLWPVIVSAIMQGTIVAAIAVFGNEIIKQVVYKRVEDKEK